jgi:hypothetical protein
MKPPRPLRLLLVALAATTLPALAAITEPNNHKVIFRYRTFSVTQPSYVSPLTSAGNISFAAGSSDIVTTDRGAGFDDLIVTDFDGSTEFLQGASALNTTDSAGETNFSVETWFKADSVSGVRALFSNTESNHGFALKIENGRLRGYVRFKNGTTPVPYIIDQEVAYPNLSTGRWYYAVLHCRKLGSLYEIKLYLDGVRVAYVTTSGVWNGVYQSTEKPMVGAEPGGGTATGDYFDGQIYAVVVSNHGVFLDNYVKVKVVRDGGRYFGSPSYHDYLDTTASVDYRLDETTGAYADVGTKQVDRMTNPFVNDGYIPQTISYVPSSGYFYVSSYWRDVDGTIASPTYQPARISIVAEINKATNSLRRVFRLYKPDGSPNYGHLGALAHHNGNLYISYGTAMHRYSLATAPNPNYIFNPQTFANPKGDQNPLTAVSGIDLVSYLQGNTSIDSANVSVDSNGDTILWTSDWDTVDIRKLHGFKLNADGSIAVPAVYSFNLPATIVNGIACYSASATDLWFYILSAGGDNPSYLRRVRYLKSSATPQSSTIVFTGPAGEEGLTMVGTQVWATSESGGRFYQSRTTDPWTDLYPFLYGVAP